MSFGSFHACGEMNPGRRCRSHDVKPTPVTTPLRRRVHSDSCGAASASDPSTPRFQHSAPMAARSARRVRRPLWQRLHVTTLLGFRKIVIFVPGIENLRRRPLAFHRACADGGGCAIIVGDSPFVVEIGNLAVARYSPTKWARGKTPLKLMSPWLYAFFVKGVPATMDYNVRIIRVRSPHRVQANPTGVCLFHVVWDVL